MYVEIDIFKFIKDDLLKNVVVEILDDENYIYLDEFEPLRSVTFSDELLIVAYEWIIDHVRVVKEI